MANVNQSNVVLECKDLRISFKTLSGTVKAVRGISFNLEKGKTLAIVGESGSGKSVTSRAILGILANNKIVEGGQILYDGKDLLQLSEDQFTSIRGSKISMIFQDPLSSLNPIMRVGKQLTEPMFLKAKTTRKEAKSNVSNYLTAINRLGAENINKIDFATFSKVVKAFESNSKIENLIESIYLKIEKLEKKIAKLDPAKHEAKINLLKEEIYRKNEVIDSHKVQIEANSTEITEYLNSNEVTVALKEIISSDYSNYISSLVNLKADLINFKEKVFITTFDYEKRITSYEEEIEKLTNERLDKVRSIYEKIVELENKFSDATKPEILKLKEERASLNAEYEAKIAELRLKIATTLDFNVKEALAEIKLIQNSIDKCVFNLGVEKDDIVSVFATSLKRYIDSYIESIALAKDYVKFIDKYNNYEEGFKEEIPAKLRAKRREVVVPFYKFYNSMVTSIDNIIVYIQEQLIDAVFDIDAYYVAFKENFKKQISLAANKVKKSQAKARALELLKEVGIPEPERRYYQYPFEFSGGMRQRIVIAIALSSNPEILICDEPTTALDVTIQAQILELINKMKAEHNLSIIFITHDLGVVANMADDIAVMYAGKIVEIGNVYDIFYDPRHPYTWALLGSMPDLDTKGKLDAIPGTPPNMLLPPKGDAFAARNKYAMKIDYEMQPPFFKISDSHSAATWLLHSNAPTVKAPKVVVERIKNSIKQNSNNKPVYVNAKNSILEEGGIN